MLAFLNLMKDQMVLNRALQFIGVSVYRLYLENLKCRKYSC
jgi:hypothetical protein